MIMCRMSDHVFLLFYKGGTNGYINVVQKKKTEPVMCNKSTSTSDPVMEDDHVQVGQRSTCHV